jgi:hypothetical protein
MVNNNDLFFDIVIDANLTILRTNCQEHGGDVMRLPSTCVTFANWVKSLIFRKCTCLIVYTSGGVPFETFGLQVCANIERTYYNQAIRQSKSAKRLPLVVAEPLWSSN